MEESKLVALYNDLKGGYKGKNVGLGVGAARRAVEDASLPQNALYRNFVRAGTYDPSLDTVAPEFRGKKLTLGAEDKEGGYAAAEPAPAPAPADSEAADAEAEAAEAEAEAARRRRKERKRARAEAEELAPAPAPAPAAVAVEDDEEASAPSRFRLKKRLLALLAAAPKGRLKTRRLVRAVVEEGVAAGALEADTAAAAVEAALAKLVRRARAAVDGKYTLGGGGGA